MSQIVPCVQRYASAVLALAAYSYFGAGAAFAQNLSFAEALAQAERNAPQLLADSQLVKAAELSVLPAGALPDPKLQFGLDNILIEGANRFQTGGDFMTMRRVGLMQDFPNRAKRAARIETAQAQIAVARAQRVITLQSVRLSTAVAWIARRSAERELAALVDLRTENKLLAGVVLAQLAGGKGMLTDAVMPRVEAAMIDERENALTSQVAQANAELHRWLGAPAGAPLVGEVPDWSLELATLRAHLNRHPQLQAFASKETLLQAQSNAAKADKHADWTLEVAYQQRGRAFGDMVSIQASFDLPFFTKTRQDPLIAAKAAELQALEFERESTTREHAALLEAQLAEHARLVKTAMRIEQILLPLAAEKCALASAAWQSGNADLSALIAARQERVELLFRAISLRGEVQQRAAQLHFAYGGSDPLSANENTGRNTLGNSP